ncbi:hypothetical protein AGMMS49959_15240 [Planctomycetales bacterium]|nr:hypothetical protein AGMMS49959_15240 [Planctomycetales bacterium]
MKNKIPTLLVVLSAMLLLSGVVGLGYYIHLPDGYKVYSLAIFFVSFGALCWLIELFLPDLLREWKDDFSNRASEYISLLKNKIRLNRWNRKAYERYQNAVNVKKSTFAISNTTQIKPMPDPLCPTMAGHKVRSHYEQAIDNFLFVSGVKYQYEKEILNKKYRCDWYLIDYDIYVEYWGMQGNAEYEKNMRCKLRIYTDNNLRLISLDSRNFPDFIYWIDRNLRTHGIIPPWEKSISKTSSDRQRLANITPQKNAISCEKCGETKFSIVEGKFGGYLNCKNCKKNIGVKGKCPKCGNLKLQGKKDGFNLIAYCSCRGCGYSQIYYTET